jgi:hypothetical protein
VLLASSFFLFFFFVFCFLCVFTLRLGIDTSQCATYQGPDCRGSPAVLLPVYTCAQGVCLNYTANANVTSSNMTNPNATTCTTDFWIARDSGMVGGKQKKKRKKK